MRIDKMNTPQAQEAEKGLQYNLEKYGKKYCPCVPEWVYSTEQAEDVVCMCKEFKEMEEGICRCGLYKKTK